MNSQLHFLKIFQVTFLEQNSTKKYTKRLSPERFNSRETTGKVNIVEMATRNEKIQIEFICWELEKDNLSQKRRGQ